jgi:hypothetical protein
MKKQFYYFLIMAFLVLSCRRIDHGKFPVIPVNIGSDVSLPLSTITDEITAIELETMGESLINPDRIMSVHLFEDQIFLHVQNEILVFSIDGKFVRSVGSQGSGPGEFLILLKLALDEKNKRLIIVDHSKLICYDLNGEFLFQSSDIFEKGKFVVDINRVNDEIFALVDQLKGTDAKGSFSQPQIYRMNDSLQIMDSLTIRKTYYEKLTGYGYAWKYLSLNNSESNAYYIYCPERLRGSNVISKAILSDTLYRFENNSLIPELKLNFKNINSGDAPLEIGGIYRSARYVFAVYLNRGYYRFCYDTKTGNGYNMKNGFTDDLHQIVERINIRPFAMNTELFYYWHTHINEKDALHEPNPTLYIGRLRK